VAIKKPDEDTIRSRLKELAQVRRCFGYRRLHTLLKRGGITINHKYTLRLYRLENLSIRIRSRKRLAAVARVELPKAIKPNQRWSMDFLSHALCDSRRIKVLLIVDDYSHKCHAIEVDTSINGRRVCEVLNRIAYKEGLPEVITIDNGPEFIGKALDAWAYQRQIYLRFIRPGKPVDNAYIESFNGKFRDECLNENWFMSLDHARQVIEEWRMDYNNKRSHSLLNDLTPEEFLRQETTQNGAENYHL
jgi:putative transposase